MRYLISLLALVVITSAASAQDGAFSKGPVFEDFGPVADVEVTMPIPRGTSFKISFDLFEPAPAGKANSTLVSAARFINMHARAGVPIDDIQIAVVVHGQASREMADASSGSAELIAALTGKGVRIILCGQSASYYGVAVGDLLPGVEMALSAMTAHALLQQQGYTLNPF